MEMLCALNPNDPEVLESHRASKACASGTVKTVSSCFNGGAFKYRSVLMDDHKEAEAIVELSRAIELKPDLQLLHLRAAFYDSMSDY